MPFIHHRVQLTHVCILVFYIKNLIIFIPEIYLQTHINKNIVLPLLVLVLLLVSISRASVYESSITNIDTSNNANGYQQIPKHGLVKFSRGSMDYDCCNFGDGQWEFVKPAGEF